MKIAPIILMLVSLPQMSWAQQAAATERIAQLLAAETHCVTPESLMAERRSIRILDSSQLSVPAASFQLAGWQQTTRDGYLATVRCASAAECLPFLVSFHCDSPAAAPSRQKAVRQRKRGSAVHAGERARLELAIPGANLSFPVICLEEGDVGEVVRTRAVATNRVFAAMVTGLRQLRGVEGVR